MAIPKKGSRNITVSGKRFRWVVSIHNNTANLVVELADEPGQRLLAYFECRDLHICDENGEWKFHSQKQSITPASVRRLICHGLGNDWRPDQKGPPFVVQDAAKVAMTMDAERIDSRDIDPDADVAYIKDVARDFISTYMALSLCLDGEMYDRIMAVDADERIPIDDHNMERLGLSFCVFRDAPTPDGCPIIALQCNEFPDIIEHYWWTFFGLTSATKPCRELQQLFTPQQKSKPSVCARLRKALPRQVKSG